MTRTTGRTNKLIPFAKISDKAVLRVVQGFARGEPVAAIAKGAEISERASRSIVMALRYRLLRPRFYKWTVFYEPALALDQEALFLAASRVHVYFARCYYDQACQSNFQQELRQERACRSCPLDGLDFLDPDERDAARAHMDFLRIFYANLGIRAEPDLPPLTAFRLRYYHMLAVGEAFEASRHTRDGRADMRDKGERSAWSLYQALVKDLTDDPLIRADPPLAEVDKVFGDLTSLD